MNVNIFHYKNVCNLDFSLCFYYKAEHKNPFVISQFAREFSRFLNDTKFNNFELKITTLRV